MTTRPYTSVWNDLNQVEFSQGFLQAGPYRTRYLHAGDTSKPVLLLLHGITGHAEAYVRNLASHAEHFSVSEELARQVASARARGGLACP